MLPNNLESCRTTWVLPNYLGAAELPPPMGSCCFMTAFQPGLVPTSGNHSKQPTQR
jgi:hypothetical protein